MRASTPIGLCAACEHRRNVRSARGSEFVLCARSVAEPAFAKYPQLPVRHCAGYSAAVKRHALATSTIRMQVAEAGAGPAVLLLHGFPESAYSWRHQLPALAQAGYRAIAPDQRGYGGSDKPHAIEAYDQVELAQDVVALLDALKIERAVVVGHDWGAPVAWHVALLHPERVRAVVGMSVPYGGRPQRSPLAGMKQRFADAFFYILYFQVPGVAEAELEADVQRSLRMFYYSASAMAPRGSAFTPRAKSDRLLDTMLDPETLPAWLSQADLDHFSAEFARGGFRGPLNWYRNFDRSFERTAALAGKQISQPAFFVAGEHDPVLAWSRGALERMPALAPRLRPTLIVEGAGHWVQQEQPDTVNSALLRFLAELD